MYFKFYLPKDKYENEKFKIQIYQTIVLMVQKTCVHVLMEIRDWVSVVIIQFFCDRRGGGSTYKNNYQPKH